jgi:hypothetical protein
MLESIEIYELRLSGRERIPKVIIYILNKGFGLKAYRRVNLDVGDTEFYLELIDKNSLRQGIKGRNIEDFVFTQITDEGEITKILRGAERAR